MPVDFDICQQKSENVFAFSLPVDPGMLIKLYQGKINTSDDLTLVSNFFFKLARIVTFYASYAMWHTFRVTFQLNNLQMFPIKIYIFQMPGVLLSTQLSECSPG